MPSTYTLNNGIELISTGEQSGTWGDTTNLNLKLLDTALDGQVTVTLSTAGTSGSPNTLTITDGTASDGRNRLVIFNDGADLGATAFVQLNPNDAEKIIYIRNDLSGSRSILLFQGTYDAANDYEVPAGTTAVVAFDGNGTGAVAANAFDNALFDSVDINGGTIDGTVIGGTTAAAATTTDLTASGTISFSGATVSDLGTVTTADINGGTIDGTVIGGSTPAAITGTTGDFSGDLTVDTDTLYVDSSNNRVGIGTSSPEDSLHIIHGGTTGFKISSSGTAGLNIEADSDGTQGGPFSWEMLAGGSSGDLLWSIGGSEAMRIDSSGNVGIGTSSPSDTFDVNGVFTVNGGAGTGIEFDSSSRFRTLGSGFQLDASNNSSSSPTYTFRGNGSTGMFQAGFNQIGWSIGGSEAMRIDSSGNLLVGTTNAVTSADSLVRAFGFMKDSGGRPFLGVSSDTSSGVFQVDVAFADSANRPAITFDRHTFGQVGSISCSPTTTSYNTSSDERLKENIADAQPASDLIGGIQVREFDWKADGEHQRYGMVAQELETVAPEAVTKGETEDDMWSVDYSKLVPMLVKEIQDLRKRVAELEYAE